MGSVRLLALCGVLAAVRCAGGQAITIGALFVCPDEPANAADCRSDAGFNNMAAVRVAVADANADASILPGRTLQIEDVPITALRAMTYGREAEGQDIASDLQAAGAVAAVGAGFSSDSFVLAPALAVHDIPLISHSATNEDLSNTTAFPLFARAVQPDTVFLVASLTKVVTATAVMMLIEEGKLALDQTLASVLPGVHGPMTAITIRHLLTHTSGLPDEFPDNTELRRASAPLSEFVGRICGVEAGQQLAFAPGTDIAYQSTGLCLLGAAVEKLSGIDPTAQHPAPALLGPSGPCPWHC